MTINDWEQGLTNYSLPPVFVNQVLLEKNLLAGPLQKKMFADPRLRYFTEVCVQYIYNVDVYKDINW